MADLSGLGDLVLTVGGDITPLTSALDEIPAAAQSAASSIQAAFDALPSATEEVNHSLANLSAGLNEAGSSASETAGHVAEVPPALHDTSEAAGEAGSKLKEFVTAGLELAGIAVTFEALKEAVTEIVSAFDQLQRATISLTALTGSAEQATTAIDSLKTLAIGEGLSFPSLVTAQQRMYAFGISATQIPQLLQAAANAAAVMGTDIESAASRLDRIAVSGTVAARQLTSLGLSTHDLALAMNVADSAVKTTFASLDQSQRVEVLITALQKFQGVAAAVADTLSGRWQSFKTSVEVALEGVGEAIDTSLVSTVATAQESVVPGIQAMTKAFQDLASVFGPVITGAINSFTQGMGDLLNVVSSGISTLVTLGKSANDTGVSFSQLVGYVKDVTPWGLFADSIHQAAVDLNLLHANADMAAASLLVMDQRFASVTDSLKSFIDKTSAGHDNLLAIRTDFDSLKQAVTDAETHLALVTEAYNKGMASAGQLEAATKALATAQTALNGTLDTTKLTLSGIQTSYDALRTAVTTAQANIDLVSRAYLDGKASIAQYQDAVDKLKAAQDALNGVMKQTPMDQVNAALLKLQQNADNAKAYLDAVTEAMKTNQGAAVLLADAQRRAADAQAALTGTAQTAATQITASGTAITTGIGKVIEVATNLGNTAPQSFTVTADSMGVAVGQIQRMATVADTAATSTSNFVGPIQQVANTVQILNGSIPSLTDNWSALNTKVYGAGDAFAQSAQDLLDYINEADSATTATDNLAQAAQNAGAAAESLGSQLDAAMATASEGGGTLGMRISLRPGDVYGQYGAGLQVPGGPGAAGGGGSPTGSFGPEEMVTFDPLGAAAALAQSGEGLRGSSKHLDTAATNLTAAATVQQDAAQTAYDAAKAQLVGAKQLEIAANATATGADAISAGVLAAADAANQAASDASMAMVTSSTIAAAATQAIAGATSAILVTTQIAAAVATKAGVPGFTTFTAFTTPSPNMPNVSGPGPSSTGGLAFANPYTYSGGNAGNSPVNINVNGSQFIQNLMNEFVQQLQTQGVRLTRG